jgi:antitoxin component YwqK of YwqJK toxin-antitoxin module
MIRTRIYKTGFILIALLAFTFLSFGSGEGKRKHFEYYESGALKVKGQFKNDLKHGIWKSYYESGVRSAKEKFKKGVRLYKLKYDTTGKLIIITNKKGEERKVEGCGC